MSLKKEDYVGRKDRGGAESCKWKGMNPVGEREVVVEVLALSKTPGW